MRLKSFALSVWNMVDPIYYACTRLRCVGQDRKNSTFRVRLTSFKGRNVHLSDGSVIEKGDTLLKIHLHNVILLKDMLSIKNEIKKGKFLYRAIEQSLPDLAVYLQHHPKINDIKGIIGITMLNKGVGGLGFEAIPIPNSLYKWVKYVTMIPIYFLSANQPLKHVKKQSPAYLIMSKNVLMQKYGGGGADTALREPIRHA
ncbi:hypothetical protein [Paenibacillus sp. MSJ-34]|uniref:YkoP family protein n=1 Tax=Paenibacillus sp. MSJ-34 TaxID=2841529 RepID=UPI00209CA15E|nr:hypothetical protein [Paenibacillus sp. MSJ-34]